MKKIFYKIRNIIGGFIYALPFGLKAANDEMFTSKSSSNSDTLDTIRKMENGNVYEDLLSCHVTQEVKNLRYRTYLISEESRKYRYRGGDRGEKSGIIIPKDENIINFIQKNKQICDSVFDELSRIGEYSQDKFTLKVVKEETPTFVIERYVDAIEVFIDKLEGVNEVSFFFPKEEDKYNPRQHILNNRLKAKDLKNDDLFTDILGIEFVTSRAEGVPDFVKYNINNLKVKSVEENNDFYIIVYTFESYSTVNLLEKYFEKEVDDEYREKKAKNTTYVLNTDLTNNPNEVNKKKEIYICSTCGKQISKFESESTKEAIGEQVCLDCLSKRIKY